jgi:hypothetical protein
MSVVTGRPSRSSRRRLVGVARRSVVVSRDGSETSVVPGRVYLDEREADYSYPASAQHPLSALLFGHRGQTALITPYLVSIPLPLFSSQALHIRVCIPFRTTIFLYPKPLRLALLVTWFLSKSSSKQLGHKPKDQCGVGQVPTILDDMKLHSVSAESVQPHCMLDRWPIHSQFPFSSLSSLWELSFPSRVTFRANRRQRSTSDVPTLTSTGNIKRRTNRARQLKY